MRLGLIVTLGFLLIASFVALVGYLFKTTSDAVELEIGKLRISSIGEVVGASEMRLALQASQVAAQQIIAERYRVLAEPNHETGPVVDIQTSIQRTEDSLDEFERQLQASWRSARAELEMERQGQPADRDEEKWLMRLERELAVHRSLMNRFIHLAEYHPSDQVSEFLVQNLQPHYQAELLPLIRAYEKNAESELSHDLDSMIRTHQAANRRNLLVTTGAFFTAVVLGLLISRSISRPLTALQEAAARAGAGELSTRVQLGSHNEIGIVADAFNRMLGDLEASTVSRTYLDNIIQSMKEMLIVTDSDDRIRTVNRVVLEEMDYEEGELLGQPASHLFDTQLDPAKRTGERTFLTKAGLSFPVYCSQSVMRDPSGSPVGSVLVAQNITERKQSEARLRASLKEKDVLLREVHHRVKNNLQIISSLLNLQNREGEDVAADRTLRESRNRIRSMALIHEQLYRSDDLANIDFAEYAQRLVSIIFRSYTAEAGDVELNLDIDPTPLTIDRAIPCGLILNELLSNALEHAFPERSGAVSVAFHFDGTRCRLEVRDDGIGLPEDLDPQQTRTLGLRLVSALTDQLGGTLQFSSAGGTRVSVEFDRAPEPRTA